MIAICEDKTEVDLKAAGVFRTLKDSFKTTFMYCRLPYLVLHTEKSLLVVCDYYFHSSTLGVHVLLDLQAAL